MANDCLAQVQACRIRVARLDPTGVPQPGASNLYVSDALVSFGFGWETEAGDEISEKNACGTIKVNYRGDEQLRRGNVSINLVTPDPQLSEMLSGGVVLTDGAAVGYAAPSLGPVDSDPVSIEIWTKRINNGRLDSTFPYAWWVYPWIEHLRPDDHEHSNANLGMSFAGEALENDNWYDGPLNDWPSTSDRVFQWIPTTSLPNASCGYQTLAAS